jgi:Skp family chaperone for outer membrane proteins
MKKTLIGATLALFVLAPAAHAACTQQELQAKAANYSKRVQEVIQKDHSKAQALGAKVQEASQKLQEAMKQPGAGMDEVCAFYDKLIAELDAM